MKTIRLGGMSILAAAWLSAAAQTQAGSGKPASAADQASLVQMREALTHSNKLPDEKTLTGAETGLKVPRNDRSGALSGKDLKIVHGTLKLEKNSNKLLIEQETGKSISIHVNHEAEFLSKEKASEPAREVLSNPTLQQMDAIALFVEDGEKRELYKIAPAKDIWASRETPDPYPEPAPISTPPNPAPPPQPPPNAPKGGLELPITPPPK